MASTGSASKRCTTGVLTPKRSTAYQDGSSGTQNGTPFPASPSPNRGKRPIQFTQESSQEFSTPKKKIMFSQESETIEKKLDAKELDMCILLPNKKAIRFRADSGSVSSVEGLLNLIRDHAESQEESKVQTRRIDWGPDVWLEDTRGDNLTDETLLALRTECGGTVSLLLQDGNPDSSFMDANFWDVTPKLDLVSDVPHGYTLETALADHVDNALQAVWFNDYSQTGGKRMISVNLTREKMVIFDTGRGMDGGIENCIENWATMGGSTHRLVHHKGVGLEPPFLQPYLGKYGAGGVAAAFHLGNSVSVRSKTVKSKKVVGLEFALNILKKKHAEELGKRTWTTAGNFRLPEKEEIEKAPNGSFTQVEISDLKEQYSNVNDGRHDSNVHNLRRFLKDIYFPYIQSEHGPSGRTDTPVCFEVNGMNLLEVINCETAIFKANSCNGQPFVVDVRMEKTIQSDDKEKSGSSPTKTARVGEANARITCFYYGKKKGKESLATVLNKVNRIKPGSTATFDNVNRVVIRWLGRLLPQVNWSTLPFMEMSSRKAQKYKDLKSSSKRSVAFIDLDAGFHPNQSKIELEISQPFVAALKNLGTEKGGATALGVTLKYKVGDKVVTNSQQFFDEYVKWLKAMHEKFDEEFTFGDQAEYVFNQGDNVKELEELGVGKRPMIVFHKHLKDAQDWKITPEEPIRIRLPKGTMPSMKSDKYATVEYFFHYGAEDGDCDVNVLYRDVEVGDSEGCQIFPVGDSLMFQLNRSKRFSAALLSSAKRLNESAWKKKVEEVVNKSPGSIDFLGEEDTKQFEHDEVFPPNNSIHEAGFRLPSTFLAVVRPKKGSGPAFKQGMVVAEPLSITLTATHCRCPGGCVKRGVVSDGHGRPLFAVKSHSIETKSGLKGLYSFSIPSFGETNSLIAEGTYTFKLEIENATRFKDVKSRMRSMFIRPSEVTAKWTLCTHEEDSLACDHGSTCKGKQPLVIRIHEGLKNALFLQKFDKHGNRQNFEKHIYVDLEVVSLQGESLNMKESFEFSMTAGAGERKRLQLKELLFRHGSLEAVKPSYKALLRAHISENHMAEISCQVLPGTLAKVLVKDGEPCYPLGDIIFFHRALHPMEIIRTLTLQGTDRVGNNIEKFHKMSMTLEGLELQDNGGLVREVDENGCLQLGGLLKVTCPFNSQGSLEVSSKESTFVLGFGTVIRKLVATQIPRKAYVGTALEGVRIKIVDQNDDEDWAVEGPHNSVTADWLEGVTCPLIKGECVLPRFNLPKTPGFWKGDVHLSQNLSLATTIEVELVLDTARSIGLTRRGHENFASECGVAFVIPFAAFDSEGNPAILTDSMLDSIIGTPDLPCTFDWKGVKSKVLGGIPNYEAHFVLLGIVGVYKIILKDSSAQLGGQVETVCTLRAGKVARLVLSQSSGIQSSVSPSIHRLQVRRRSDMIELTVTLVDSNNNVCTSCENRQLKMKIPGVPEFQTSISDGIGRFNSKSLNLPVGEYEGIIELESTPESLYSLEEDDVGPLQTTFVLEVVAGNYPTAVEVLGMEEVLVAKLTDESVQFLEPITVLVESADGNCLQDPAHVGVNVSSLSSPETMLEYSGSFVCKEEESQDEFSGLKGRTRYEIRQVPVPRQAEQYKMEFFVKDVDGVASVEKALVVIHGPPCKGHISHRESGLQILSLEVSLLDSYGNVCTEESGFVLSAKLIESPNNKISSGKEPCRLISQSSALVIEGRADFGALQLSPGQPGMYVLQVSREHVQDHQNLESSILTEDKVLIIMGNVTAGIEQLVEKNRKQQTDYKACSDIIARSESKIAERKRTRLQLESRKMTLEGEMTRLEEKRREISVLQENARDSDVLQRERDIICYTESDILSDFHNLVSIGNSAPWAFWDAQSGTNFLSPQFGGPGARDFVGLVPMLGRVESVALNKCLSELAGLSNLCTIVCRTQRGADMLQEEDASGNIDYNRGLHGFARARGYNIWLFDVLALTDIERIYTGEVDMEHPQQILKIRPPLLYNNEVPRGFLGYAVNLIHLKVEHLRMVVMTPHGEAGLRASLFFKIFQFNQVYDTRKNMNFAKANVRGFRGGAVSLDGGRIKQGGVQQLGRPKNQVPVQFCMVPFEERMRTSLLQTPASFAFQRSAQHYQITEDCKKKEVELKEIRKDIEKNEDELQKLESYLAHARLHEQVLQDGCSSIGREIHDLQRARYAIVERNNNGTLTSCQVLSNNCQAFFI